jgi:hypothetical protein|tara:strand:- start:614 stop:1051 length:438 start_codon:yes stop_codon:yes gene_type:complete
MRRAQADIIGLVVIVILFIIIAVVFLRLSTLQDTDSVIRENIQVSNLLNAMMKLTPCKTIQPLQSLSDIIDECDHQQQYCGEDCKDYIKTQIESTANNALDKETYSLSIIKNSNTFINVGSCIGSTKFVDKAITPRFVAKLEVCR